MSRRAVSWFAVIGCVVAMSCNSRSEKEAGNASSGEKAGYELMVFAASSLKDAFEKIAVRFREQNPGTKVTFNFAGSQQLAAQILEGAPADVFASANQEQMKRVVDAKLAAGEPRVFATNSLAIAVEPGNPKKIGRLADLVRPDVVVVLAAEEVPAGRYAREALKKAGVGVSPSSLETDVRAVVSKVALGEADAGIVYRSDIVAAGDTVASVPIPAQHNVNATYPIVAAAHGKNTSAARAFIDLVLSEDGRGALTSAGFTPP